MKVDLKIFFISAIKTIYIVSANNIYSDLCPLECIEPIDLCLEKNSITGVFTPFPPENSLGQCFCENRNKYFNCLNCYGTKTGNKQYSLEEVNIRCNLLSNTTSVIPTTVNALSASVTTEAVSTIKTSETTSNTANPTETKNLNSENLEDYEKKGKYLGFIIIGIVALFGGAGYAYYLRVKKVRLYPIRNIVLGPQFIHTNQQYDTLAPSKEMSESQNNLSGNYNNQYYGKENNNYGYSQNQNYGNQYPLKNNGTVQPLSPPTQYLSRHESINPSSRPITTNNTGKYIVIYKYDPQLEDELELHVNDKVHIIEEYEDVWMKVKNITTGKEGMAPKVCVKET